jgi:hypothetical protein
MQVKLDENLCRSHVELFRNSGYDADLFTFCLYSPNGQNVALVKPAFSASIAACELQRPAFQVNTSVVSFGMYFLKLSKWYFNHTFDRQEFGRMPKR